MKSDFIFTSNYVELLASNLINHGYELYVYDFRMRKLMDFQSKKIKKYFSIFKIFDDSFLRIPVNILAFIFFSLRNKKNFDIVHVLYIRSEFFLLSHFVKKIGKKLALSIFGSDLEKGSSWKVYFTKLFHLADEIHCQNPQIYDKFLDKYIPMNSREIINQKKNIIEYPIESLKILSKRNHLIDQNYIEKEYSLDENEIIIFCGTTARFDLEQSYSLVRAIKKSNIIKKYNLKIIFPLSYGGNMRDIKKFKKFVISNLILKEKIIFIDRYLTICQILALRKITDIFINVRLHDQLVTSMLEAFYCKSYVITGDWLPYDILKENNFFYFSISKINEIINLLPKIIDSKINNEDIDKLVENTKITMNLWNPENMTVEWNEFYKKMLKIKV